MGLKGKPVRCVGFRGTRLQIPVTCVTRGRLPLLSEPSFRICRKRGGEPPSRHSAVMVKGDNAAWLTKGSRAASLSQCAASPRLHSSGCRAFLPQDLVQQATEKMQPDLSDQSFPWGRLAVHPVPGSASLLSACLGYSFFPLGPAFPKCKRKGLFRAVSFL